MAAKYQELFHRMLKEHEAELASFKELHDKYEKDPEKFQDEYNEKGQEFLEIVQKYERMLTSHSENSGYGKFTGGLSDKFRSAVKVLYPKLDFIGVKRI
jgi:hypothetical protein